MRDTALRAARIAIVGVLVTLPAVPRVTSAQVLKVTELTTEQIGTLDRERTVVLLPGGILEEHGPYLPSFTDGYQNEHYTRQLADAIASRPGWTALVFPTIPLGSGGANQIGGKHAFPGTYAIRPATVRAVFMDLADELGEQRFTWVFIVHGHGSPDHNRALHEAGEYFRHTYGGRMVHLLGLGGKQQPGRPIQQQPQHILADLLPSAALAEEGLGVHAGVVEHSRLLALRPELVPPEVRKATPVTARNRADLRRLAMRPAWPGYFGTPARATAELGHELLKDVAQQLIETAMWILDGGDERGRRLFLDVNPVGDGDPVMGPARRHEATRERRQQAWLARRMPSAVMTAQEDRSPIREDHRQALIDTREAWGRAIAAGDVERIFSFWTDDVVIYPVDGPPVKGKAAVREYVRRNRQELGVVPRMHLLEVAVSASGDLGYTVGTHEWVDREGRATRPGRYVTLWRRNEAGEWKCFLEIHSPRFQPERE